MNLSVLRFRLCPLLKVRRSPSIDIIFAIFLCNEMICGFIYVLSDKQLLPLDFSHCLPKALKLKSHGDGLLALSLVKLKHKYYYSYC